VSCGKPLESIKIFFDKLFSLQIDIYKMASGINQVITKIKKNSFLFNFLISSGDDLIFSIKKLSNEKMENLSKILK